MRFFILIIISYLYQLLSEGMLAFGHIIFGIVLLIVIIVLAAAIFVENRNLHINKRELTHVNFF